MVGSHFERLTSWMFTKWLPKEGIQHLHAAVDPSFAPSDKNCEKAKLFLHKRDDFPPACSSALALYVWSLWSKLFIT